MATNAELVDGAMRFFFETALPQATQKRLGDLPDPMVHVGAYQPWEGGAVSAAGGQVTPRFALRVGPALALSGNTAPQGAATAVPADASAHHLMWLRHVADTQADDAAEIQRVMADLDSFANVFGAAAAAPEGGGGSPAPGPAGGGEAATRSAAAHAAQWAQAIAGNRAAVADLNSLSAVPEAFSALVPDVVGLKQVLQHFFTYTPEGAHYPRWAGTGRDAGNPEHLHADYKRHNLLEVQLPRERVYMYAVLPEAVLSGTGSITGGSFREIVVRFDPAEGEAPFTLATVHTARWRRDVADHADFVFFYAEAGTGMQVRREVQHFMSAGTGMAVLALQESADPAQALTGITAVTTPPDGTPLVHLLAVVEGEPTFPAGVSSNDTGDVRVVLAPPDQIAAVAALPEVRHVGVISPSEASNDLAAAAVQAGALAAKLPEAKRGGEGVLVGVIDTGIDGTHPAFAGRIHAVWDQGSPPATMHLAPADYRTPRQNHPGNAAYADFDWGVELQGDAVRHAGDVNGHGTHVAGTAAGAEVRDPTGANVLCAAGLAPRAKLAIVRAIDIGSPTSNPAFGARWIFQKATELGLPCVINMSYGSHHNGHDGTAVDARRYFDDVRSGGNYRPGRILVAAAGNDRSWPIHAGPRIVRPGPNRVRLTGVRFTAAPADYKHIEIWVRHPGGSADIPLDLWVYRDPLTGPGQPVADSLPDVRVGSSHTKSFNHYKTAIVVTSQKAHALNGDHNFQVQFSPIGGGPMTTPITWGLAMRNRTSQPLEVHAWIASGGRKWDSAFDDVRPAEQSFMIGSPGATPATVSVAASVSRATWTDIDSTTQPVGGTPPTVGTLTSFSSPGPLRPCSRPLPSLFSGVTHPINAVDVTAPGQETQSAFSSQLPLLPGYMTNPQNRAHIVNGRAQIMSGTSMASPVITGLIANLLAVEPQLTFPQALDRLRDASRIPGQPAPPAGARPADNDWGWGLVDAGALRP